MQYKIFPLKYIPVERGKNYLADVGIGTVSAFPGSSALLVTANPDELIKAMAILNLVDSQDRFEVGRISSASLGGDLPSNEQIASKLGNIAVGSFTNPPAVNAKYRAMIDIHNGEVIFIAPARKLETILSAVDELSNESNSEAAGNWTAPELARADMSGLVFAGQDSVTAEPSTVATMLEKEMAEKPAPVKPYEPKSIDDGEKILQLALPEKLAITDFLGFVGEHLNLNYLYKEDDLKGEVTLRRHGKLRGPIKMKELYPLLEQVMQFHGFVMTRRGNLVTIVPVKDAQTIDPEIYPDSKDIEVGDAVISRVFTLQHIDTTNAKNLLETMKLVVSVEEIAATKTLIVTGFSYRMPRIEALLDLVDRPGEPRKFRFRQLQYTVAETLSSKIEALAEQLGTVKITIAEAPQTAPRVSTARKPGETTAAYTARIRRESQQAAARARTTSTTTAQEDKAGVYLDFDRRTNRILMIGTQDQLDEVEELIDTLDVAEWGLRSPKLYKIVNVDAEEVRKKLEELQIVRPVYRSAYPYSSSRITSGVQQTTASTRTTSAASPTTTMSQVTSREEEAGEPQVVVVEQTNSLLVNATAEDHVRIGKIIAYLDSEMDQEEIPYKIYPLENQSPEHLHSILGPLIEETVLDKEGKIEQVIKKQEDQIEIVPDPNTFSLIVYASKKNQVWIGDLIERLDQRRPQVLIDVTLVQISKTDAFNYDLNLIQSFPDLVATSGLTSGLLPGAAEGASLVSKLLESGRDRFIDFQASGGKGTGFYGDEHINALITAMEEKDYGRILAKPKILVNDNEPGIITATDTTYVTKTTGAVVEGSMGVVQTGVDYQGYDAGITLDIVPHISRGDLLRLDITLTRSDFGTITGERPPDTTTNEINTTVTVPDGSTIILGGLLKLNQSKGGTKVPILGDIPFLGGLFRSTSNSDLQRHMYVFVKAEIIRPDDKEFVSGDLQRISDRSREAFEEHEIEFQDYRNWPGVKPRKMTPLKVLEAN
jgi:type II secretory pathway component GspD/PulD (secretin)